MQKFTDLNSVFYIIFMGKKKKNNYLIKKY